MRALAVICLGLCIACGGDPVESSPTEVLRLFLAAMDQGAADEDALRVAYELLASPARQSLEARADRAKTLAGQTFEPWQMLAQGRFRLRFSPAPRRGMRERIEGERATVTVTGQAAHERADVQLVREGKSWRVVLDLGAVNAPAIAPPSEG
jgi:hypothetical protein